MAMRIRAWPLAALLTSWVAFSLRSLDPGEQTKVSTAFETAQYILFELNDAAKLQRAKVQEALKVNAQMQSLDLLKKQNTLLNFASDIGPALKYVKATSAIASFIFTFFMPSELEVITELINNRFREVNAKLDNLDEKLDRVEESIKDNIAFNMLLSSWNDMESAIKNGAKKLKDIRTAMGETGSRIQKTKLAEEYVNVYENDKLEANLMKIYRMATLPEDPIHRNLFDRFIDEYGCDIGKLSSLMVLIKNLILSAAQQRLTYFHFKGYETRAKNGFNEVQQFFFDIRREYDERIWNCRVNCREFAKKDASKIIKSMKGSAREDIGHAIFIELKMKYPWYSWAVAAAGESGTTPLGFELRGYNFFAVDDHSDVETVKKYYIVYQDARENPTCYGIKFARTLVVFKPCKGCNSDYIVSSENVLSSKSCSNNILKEHFKFNETNFKSYVYQLETLCSTVSDPSNLKQWFEANCVDGLHQYFSKLGFIASAFNANYDACKEDKCNSNGECKGIPFTSFHQCICYEFFEGENCERRITVDDLIERYMSELRHEFGVVNGVPTAVDVFYSIRDLSKKLGSVLEKIKSSFSHTQNIVKHSDIINRAHSIVDLYGKLQNGEILFEQFGEMIDTYLKSVTTSFELENRLKKMILGKGLLDTPGNDIYNTYKQEYIALKANGCSASYNTDVANFRNSLAYLDQAVGEALLLHLKWLNDTQGTTDDIRKKYFNNIEYVRDTYKGRQKKYNTYWSSYSCGNLLLNGTGIDCKKQLTYHGMELEVKCDKQRQPDFSSLRCSSEGIWVTGINKYQLNDSGSQDICRFVWGNYGPWQSCSKSCDGGEKYRYRECLGTSDKSNCMRDQGGKHLQSTQCNMQPCCTAQYEKFKCGNGRCIAMKQVCDGRNDCGNGDDENRSTCPNLIRSGDMVALMNNGHPGQWLSCYCTVKCWFSDKHCKLRGCPGSRMDAGDWSKCFGERFYLYMLGHDDGEPILSGSSVALQYGWDQSTDRGNWLSCWVRGSVCPTRTCPGYSWDSWDTEHCRGEYFWIFAPDRHTSCSSDIYSNCKGEPIRKGDTVFVLYTIPGYWLSGSKHDIRTRTCPGRYIYPSDKIGCKWESWTIYSRY